ncbi:hypothetical protein D3C71_2180210 [compost metagenome]
MLFHRGDHQIGHRFAMVVPVAAVGQLWGHVLAEQAGHVLARRRQRIVQGAGDEHLHDRLA